MENDYKYDFIRKGLTGRLGNDTDNVSLRVNQEAAVIAVLETKEFNRLVDAVAEKMNGRTTRILNQADVQEAYNFAIAQDPATHPSLFQAMAERLNDRLAYRLI